MLEPSKEEALSRWENEGGSSLRSSEAPAKAGPAPCLPELLRNYLAQPVWGWRDPTGELIYEFYHVYKPIVRLTDRALLMIDQLDEELSFWAVSWSGLSSSGDAQPAGRWMSYAEARRRSGLRLTFKDFSQLHDELAGLLFSPSDVGSPFTSL